MSSATFLLKTVAVLAAVVSLPAWADDLTLQSLDPRVPCEKPAYPRSSLANEEQGTTVVSLLVGVDGKVTDSKIAKGSGFSALDRATLKLADCKFKPVLKDGKADAEWISLEYVWKLDE